MEKEINNFKGIVTKFGKFRKNRKDVPLRVKQNTQKYLDSKRKGKDGDATVVVDPGVVIDAGGDKGEAYIKNM